MERDQIRLSRVREQVGSARRSGDPELAFRLLDSSSTVARNSKDTLSLASLLTICGSVKHEQGDLHGAQEEYLKALQCYQAMGNDSGIAMVYNNMGSIFQYLGSFKKAQDYYRRSMDIVQRLRLDKEIGKLFNNFGSLAEDMNEPIRALDHHRNSLKIWEQLEDSSWRAVSFMNIASCHRMLGHRDSARYYLANSLALLDPEKDKMLYGIVCNRIGGNYAEVTEAELSIEWCNKGLSIARSLKNMTVEEKSCECLYKAYALLKDEAQELHYFKRYVALRDTLFGNRRTEELTRLEVAYEYKQDQLADSLERAKETAVMEQAHTASILREENRRNIFLFSAIGLLVAVGGLWSRLRFMQRSKILVQEQRDRADDMLHNILPREVARELMSSGKAKAREVDCATVLFTDFEHFTEFAERLSATELVSLVDTYFTAFDAILIARGVEKIKTVGDAYMACGGVPDPASGSALDVILGAIELQDFTQRYMEQRTEMGLPSFTMRVGIHTGPIVAGVVGSHKFAFDIWGDTVNIAARMETCGAAGSVNISASTYRMVKDVSQLRFIHRGKVPAKGKGEMDMYWVERVEVGRPELIAEA